jgi:hypothetical protein
VDAAPGKLLQLPAGSTVGIISPSINSDAAAGLGKEIDESIELESMTPNILLGRVDQSSIPASGVALQIRLHPALVKLEMKRTTYEPLIVDLLSRLLEIGNRGRGVVAVVKWPEPIPTDMEALRRALLIDQQIGVASKATLADKLGYDWANEQENLDQEGSNAMLPSPNDFTNRRARASCQAACRMGVLISEALSSSPQSGRDRGFREPALSPRACNGPVAGCRWCGSPRSGRTSGIPLSSTSRKFTATVVKPKCAGSTAVR